MFTQWRLSPNGFISFFNYLFKVMKLIERPQMYLFITDYQVKNKWPKFVLLFLRFDLYGVVVCL